MIYEKIVPAKNGMNVPVLKNGKATNSKYDPEKEARTFGSGITSENSFTVIAGLGGGYHILDFMNRNPNHFILAVENSDEDIQFLSQIECVQKIMQSKNVKVIPKEKIQDEILQTYIPALFGGINIVSNRAWFDYDKTLSDAVMQSVKNAVKLCSKDFSVQSHFGLAWQKNIMNNLKTSSLLNQSEIKFDISKTAAVIAAGPSLDITIQKIKSNRKNYCVIATDTAFSACEKNGVTPDAVMSIDGQHISSAHFLGAKSSAPVFIFDMQANSSAVRYLKNRGAQILFVKSGHPFCNYSGRAAGQNEIFPDVFCGAGTVTIAAADFARKTGFSDIEVFGADFSYMFNKPYTKGIYLDALYRMNENRTATAESSFANLLYRIPTAKKEFSSGSVNTVKITNEVLDSYRQTFTDWLEKNCQSFCYDNFIYRAVCKNTDSGNLNFPVKRNGDSAVFETPRFDYKTFSAVLKSEIENEKTRTDIPRKNMQNLTALEQALLPFIAFIRNKNRKFDFYESLKLALTKILEYTY